MPRLRLMPQALADLEAIHAYIAADNPPAADKLIERIEIRMRSLERHPHQGRERPELRPGLRSLVLGSYLVLYTATDAFADVARVLHGAQDLPALLGQKPDA